MHEDVPAFFTRTHLHVHRLTRDAVPHGMGVMVFGNGTGGGFHFRDVRRGDKYEGEFQAGYAHGLGMQTSEMRGEVYVGEFFGGQRHGCGIRIDMKVCARERGWVCFGGREGGGSCWPTPTYALRLPSAGHGKKPSTH